ncbi:unnamed protein product [Effrenium voratum]|uniref:Uncharacterized protein n=1 Tax=Effrenium voratum TaxID=2562239 RepID=A0AA36JPP4_9DINO|nr:unnamed protein product [Effrenium voratum]
MLFCKKRFPDQLNKKTTPKLPSAFSEVLGLQKMLACPSRRRAASLAWMPTGQHPDQTNAAFQSIEATASVRFCGARVAQPSQLVQSGLPGTWTMTRLSDAAQGCFGPGGLTAFVRCAS